MAAVAVELTYIDRLPIESGLARSHFATPLQLGTKDPAPQIGQQCQRWLALNGSIFAGQRQQMVASRDVSTPSVADIPLQTSHSTLEQAAVRPIGQLARHLHSESDGMGDATDR